MAGENANQEWSKEECKEYSLKDSKRDPREFLPDIYHEATNGNQPPEARISKTLSKCSALFVHLSEKQAEMIQQQTESGKKMEKLTWAIIWLTFFIAAFTVALFYYTYKESKSNEQRYKQESVNPPRN